MRALKLILTLALLTSVATLSACHLSAGAGVGSDASPAASK